MIQTLTKYLKWLIIAAAVFVGVQFSRVYVNRMQVKSIMDAEGLDARRADTGEEEVIERIKARAAATNVSVPDGVDITVDGLGDPDSDLVIKAWWVDTVDLLVTKIEVDMKVESVSETPN